MRSTCIILALALLAAGPARAQTADDHSNIRSSAATNVPVGATVAGTIEVGGDRDWFKFTLAASTRYTIFTTSLGAGMDTVLDVYRPAGSFIGGDDNGGGGLASRVDFTTTTAGTYYARVLHARSTGTGTYAIGVRPPAPPDPDAPDVTGLGRAVAGLDAPGALLLADLDRDGKVEAIAVAREGLHVLRSDARGALVAGPRLRLPLRPRSLLAADLDRDGATDLLAAVQADGGEESILALVADASRPGGFAKPRVIAFGRRPRAGDVDGDGRIDLVAVDRLAPALALYLQDPARPGELLDPVAIGPAPSGNLCLADLNGDGRLDVADCDGRVILQDPAAPGRFRAPTTLPPLAPATSTPRAAGLAAGDIDGDGAVDLVLALATQPVRLRVYRGDPAAPGAFLAPLETVGAQTAFDDGFAELDLVDTDGDGALDVVARANATPTVVFVQDAAQPGRFRSSTYELAALAWADLTGDGLPDRLRLHPQLGLATLAPAPPAGAPPLEVLTGGGEAGGRPHVADVDGDGALDVLTAGRDGSVNLHQGDPARPGRFFPGALLAMVQRDAVIRTADLNGDGRLDVAVADPTHQVVLVLLQSAVAGQFAAPVSYPCGGPNPSDLAAGDVDGDGRADLVVACFGTMAPAGSRSCLAVLRQSAAGQLGAPELLPTPGGNAEARSVAIGDVDRDGRADLVATFHSSHQVGVYRQDPANRGRFLAPVVAATGAQPERVVLADLDRDGAQDLVVASRDAPAVHIWYGQAGAPFGPRVDLATPPGRPFIGVNCDLAVGDVDRNGTLDVAVVGAAPTLGFLLNDPSAPRRWVAGAAFALAGPQTAGLALADFDRDGDADPLVGYRTAGGASSWVLHPTR